MVALQRTPGALMTSFYYVTIAICYSGTEYFVYPVKSCDCTSPISSIPISIPFHLIFFVISKIFG